MHRFGLVMLLAAGAGLVVALSTGPAANASPVDDAWPYDTFVQLPGFSAGGHLNPVDDFPLLSQGVLPWELPGGEGSYSTDWIGIQAPFVGYLLHQKVFDSSVPVPADGTTWDGLSLGPLAYFVINDPLAGLGSQVSLFPLGQNTFISDSAGIQDTFLLGSAEAPLLQNVFTVDAAGMQDVLSVGEQDFTLFDLPVLAADGGGPAEFAGAPVGLAALLDGF